MASTTAANSEERPYKPSWIDQFSNWVEKLPIPAWVFYVGLGLALIVCQMLFLWLDGGLDKAEVLLPVIIFNGSLIPFALALIHLLDNQAVTALHSMRPTLAMTEPEFDNFQYMLSNMPSRAPLIAGVAMLVFAILMERLWIAPIRFAALEQLPIFAIVFHIIDKSPAFVLGVLVYHTIRQLRLVNTINSNYIRISLFNLGPLLAFSKLTASTAVGLVVGIYGWMLINPELLADPISLGFVGAFTILALAVFVWPLFGVHRLMELEKARMLHDIDLHFEAVFSKLNQRLRDDDYSAIERLNGTITSLEIQHKRIAEIPTWPWRPGTARSAFTAIALPLILTILQVLAEQVFNWWCEAKTQSFVAERGFAEEPRLQWGQGLPKVVTFGKLELLDLIKDCRQGHALQQAYTSARYPRHPVPDWLHQQVYLHPYLKESMLRDHV